MANGKFYIVKPGSGPTIGGNASHPSSGSIRKMLAVSGDQEAEGKPGKNKNSSFV